MSRLKEAASQFSMEANVLHRNKWWRQERSWHWQSHWLSHNHCREIPQEPATTSYLDLFSVQVTLKSAIGQVTCPISGTFLVESSNLPTCVREASRAFSVVRLQSNIGRRVKRCPTVPRDHQKSFTYSTDSTSPLRLDREWRISLNPARHNIVI